MYGALNYFAGSSIFSFELETLIFSSPEPPGSQGKLIVYPCSRGRQLSDVHEPFSEILLGNPLAYGSQTPCGASSGNGGKNLYKWSRSQIVFSDMILRYPKGH